MLVSCHKVFFVALLIACLIGFLYAASGWGLIACHGEAYHGAIVETYLLLYQSFAK